MLNRRITGNNLHLYLNPRRRDIDAGAQAVHGISREMLQDKPRFADVADGFLEFVRGAEIIIHNARFDSQFSSMCGRSAVTGACCATGATRILDTLAMARELHPGKRNSLDALCDRYGVSNAHRELHGALLDAGTSR